MKKSPNTLSPNTWQIPSLVKKIIEEAKNLAKHSHVKTISENTIRTAIRLSVGKDEVPLYLKAANENESNLAKKVLMELIQPFRSSAKAKLMLSGIIMMIYKYRDSLKI